MYNRGGPEAKTEIPAKSLTAMNSDPNCGSGVDPPPGAQAASQSILEKPLQGRYLLLRELGRGGFGTTYLAADQQVASRKVVVKVLLERRAEDAWSLKKFHEEMEALARIDHPGVVSVVDFGHLPDNRPFLVMQYVSGSPLRELNPRNGMPLARMASIVQQTGRALTAAHEAGVCHRDLKPANVMVQTLSGDQDQVKLIDFGVATLEDVEVTSGSANVAGTWEYMAPEQFQGKSSPASDIYQLGALAYELATGVRPFRSTTPRGLLLQKTQEVRVRPMDLRPDLPHAAEKAILKALSPDPQDRYARARDFGDTLASTLSGAASADLSEISTQTTSFAAHGAGPRANRLKLVAALAGLALLAFIAYSLFWKPHKPNSIAVLPFENRMGDPDMEYLSDGITESLINDLSRIPTLRVSAHGAVMHYAGGKKDPRNAGRELRVDRIVRGSVSRTTDELRIEAELMDTGSGMRLWGQTYTTKMSSLSEAQKEFSVQVTDHLRLKLSGPLKDRLARQYAVGSEWYHDYLKGRFLLNKRTPGGFDAAARYFEQVIRKKNADYAPAHAGLAYTYALLAMHASVFGNVAPARMLEEARTEAQKALELDGTLAEAYTSLAYVQMQADYQWAEAEKNYTRAIDLNPNSPDAHECYALELAALGRFDESLREAQLAANLDPTAWALKAANATILYYARRFDESLAMLDAIAKGTGAPGDLGDVRAANYWAKSMPAEALAAASQLPETFTPHVRTPLLVSAYARAKQDHKARALMASYTPKPETAIWYYLAIAHMDLGEKQEALRDLELDCERKSAEILFVKVDPMLDGLRSDERFRALVTRMKLNN